MRYLLISRFSLYNIDGCGRVVGVFMKCYVGCYIQETHGNAAPVRPSWHGVLSM